MSDGFLGIDVGSVTTKAALVASPGREKYPGQATGWRLLGRSCVPTSGRPLEALAAALREVRDGAGVRARVLAVGSTGSGRLLAGTVAGADIVKNEITAHAVAALRYRPDVQTVLEIGGQDSKLIIMRHGVVVDFAMNTVCAAGTGSFLDRQASRLGIPVAELGGLALQAVHPVRIAGRCAVFAESDMIHKQQVGHSTSDIVAACARHLCAITSTT